MQDDLVIWTVYDHPADYPGGFIARKWIVRRGQRDPMPTQETRTGDTLQEVRQALPPFLHRMDRRHDDAAVIVETWM